MDKVEKMLLKLPFSCDWVQYKGKVYFSSPNCERTAKAGKPMIDLHYCATTCFNGMEPDKTVQYDKNKFKRCNISDW